MKIRRKRALGLNEPLRHADHPLPVTRRQFLGQGFMTGGVAMVGASAFSLFADPRAGLRDAIAGYRRSQEQSLQHRAGRRQDSFHLL